MRAGLLRKQIRFEKRATPATKYRRDAEPWETVVENRWARIVLSLTGREEVIAQRLAGVKAAIITARDEPALANLTTAWRIVDEANGEIYDIKHFARSDVQRGYLTITCELGATDDGD